MAFIRAYSAQGDPRMRHSFARMGVLVRGGRLKGVRLLSSLRARRGTKSRRRVVLAAGDPFRLRMPKFLRKLTLKKVAGAVKKIAPFAAAAATGGLSGIATLGAKQLLSAAMRPHNEPAPELTTQPEPTGPTSSVARSSGYQQGTYPIEVTPETSGQVYNVFSRRRPPGDEDEDEDQGEDEDVADVGDEDEDTDTDEESD